MHLRVAEQGLDVIDLAQVVGHVPVVQTQDVREREDHSWAKGEGDFLVQLVIREAEDEVAEIRRGLLRSFFGRRYGGQLAGLGLDAHVELRREFFAQHQELVKPRRDGDFLELGQSGSSRRAG